ncbi:hypothetical protein CATYP_07245 [Corynebacterium atypicum]|uniref:Secreted protein n=1 Tax=Corynebacterium atypicum TaxID=191610 RepID=A0ABM5QNT8_9CORY|nr:hypothetical protein CATYP_07245 [Corynebacterium atypicum]
MAAQLDPVRVNLHDAGAEPRSKLAYRDIGNPAQEITAAVATSLKQTPAKSEDAHAPAPPKRPEDLGETTTLPLNATTVPAPEADHGTRRVELSVGQSPEIPQAEGFISGWTADDAGQISTVRFAAPTSADDATRQRAEAALMHIVSTPIVFPHEPVGEGASWSVDSRVTGTSTLLKNTTFTVRKIDGERIELDLEITQRPAVGALELPDSGQLKVLDTDTSSTGNLTVDLTQPLPTSGSVNAVTRVVYGGDSNVRIFQDSASALSFTPAAG